MANKMKDNNVTEDKRMDEIIGTESEEIENTVDENNEIPTGKAKRIAAMMGVVLLVVMVLATFVVPFLSFEGVDQVFTALLLCDIAIPVFLWFVLRFLTPR